MRILCLISVFLMLGCSSFKERQEYSKLHLDIGVSHMNAGNYPQALAELLEAEKLDPENAEVQNQLGIVYFARDKYDISVNHFRKAVNLKPKFTEARNNLGQVLAEQNKFSEALHELNIAKEDLLYTHPEKTYLTIGITYFRMSQFAEAKKALLKSIELQRENCLAYNYYGRSLYEMKDFKKATEALDKAVGFCQRSLFDEPQYYGALSYYQTGQPNKAQNRLEELIKLYPDGKYVDKAKSMLETMKR